jgi:hypothetical protein
MGTWGRRIRGALGMGLVWAIAWGIFGGLLEAIDNVLPGGWPAIHFVDMWPQTLAMVGFPCGIVFGIVLGLAAGRRRFHDLSFSQFAGWGALAGVVAGALGMLIGAGPLLLVVTTLGSTLAGTGSLGLARVAERRGLLGAGADTAVLTDGERRRV